LQDIYYAEYQIMKALPKMIDKATNRDASRKAGATGKPHTRHLRHSPAARLPPKAA
jgi:ferritin-like metal-binding protein YciE